jgi:dTDP-3-amino-3,4,6-trideoxy-alpha-D-glucose transaminase
VDISAPHADTRYRAVGATFGPLAWREYQRLKPEIDAAIRGVLDSGVYVTGDDVDAFEREFAAFCGAGHAVSTASGTTALIVGVKALDLKPGDEVIAPAYTSICTTAAITHAGCSVRLADVDDATLTLDPDDVARRITRRTRGVVPVHLHGYVARMDALLEIAATHRLRVLEDAALAVGSLAGGRRAGTLGDAGAVSFAPTKVLGGMGWGGMLITDDAAIAYRARQLAGFGLPGIPGESELNLEGYNTQLSPIFAAALRVKLRHLPAGLARRRAIVARYTAACERLGIRTLRPHPGTEPTLRSFVVRVPDRDALAERIRTAGLDATPQYVPALHLRPVYAYLGHRRGDFPVAERATQELLCLPVHPDLADDEVDRVIDALQAA